MPLPKTTQPPARIQIQAIEPIVDCGRYAVKRTVGDRVDVYATIFKDGHDTLAGAVRVRGPGERNWAEVPLHAFGNDRWGGSFTVDRPGRWEFAVAAWTDRIATWQEEIRRKVGAGETELAGELSEGAVLLGRASVTVDEGLAAEAGDREGVVTSSPLEVDVDRVLARFGSWYELFPRSWGGFRGVAEVLPQLAAARLRRRLPAARASDRAHEPQGAEQHAHARRRATRARRGRSARRRAATTRSIRTSARWDDFDAMVAAAKAAGSSSRSTSRCSAHPTTRG